MNKLPQSDDDQPSVAEQIRSACIEEAIHAYEQAGISGLCHEGRFEVAISALRMLDLDALLQTRDAKAAQ
jgi:hypothetical protein